MALRLVTRALLLPGADGVTQSVVWASVVPVFVVLWWAGMSSVLMRPEVSSRE